MSLKELTSKTDDELKQELINLKREQMNLRFAKTQGSLEKPATLKTVRRKIARVETLVSQRIISENKKEKAKNA